MSEGAPCNSMLKPEDCAEDCKVLPRDVRQQRCHCCGPYVCYEYNVLENNVLKS